MAEGTVNKRRLVYITGARLCVPIICHLLSYGKRRVGKTLEDRIRVHCLGYTFEARARLDVPTFEDPIIERKLNNTNFPVVWQCLNALIELLSGWVRLVSELSVLIAMFREQNNGLGIAAVCCLPQIMLHVRKRQSSDFGHIGGTCFCTSAQLHTLQELTLEN